MALGIAEPACAVARADGMSGRSRGALLVGRTGAAQERSVADGLGTVCTAPLVIGGITRLAGLPLNADGRGAVATGVVGGIASRASTIGADGSGICTARVLLALDARPIDAEWLTRVLGAVPVIPTRCARVLDAQRRITAARRVGVRTIARAGESITDAAREILGTVSVPGARTASVVDAADGLGAPLVTVPTAPAIAAGRVDAKRGRILARLAIAALARPTGAAINGLGAPAGLAACAALSGHAGIGTDVVTAQHVGAAAVVVGGIARLARAIGHADGTFRVAGETLIVRLTAATGSVLSADRLRALGFAAIVISGIAGHASAVDTDRRLPCASGVVSGIAELARAAHTFVAIPLSGRTLLILTAGSTTRGLLSADRRRRRLIATLAAVRVADRAGPTNTPRLLIAGRSALGVLPASSTLAELNVTDRSRRITSDPPLRIASHARALSDADVQVTGPLSTFVVVGTAPAPARARIAPRRDR